jgi:methyl coenzyme M reductase subunit C
MEKHQSIHNQDLEKKNTHKNANIKLLGEILKHITYKIFSLFKASSK